MMTDTYLRKLIAAERLADVQAVAQKYSRCGRKQREVCFFTALFARMAGYSADAATELAGIVNGRYRKPLCQCALDSAIKGVDKFFDDDIVLSSYSNEKLVDILELGELERVLELRTIISYGERRRRKAIRDAAGYVRRRGGPSKKDKIKSRQNVMARRILNGTLDKKAFQKEYRIGRSTFYTDLKKASVIAYQILMSYLCNVCKKTVGSHKHRFSKVFDLLSFFAFLPIIKERYAKALRRWRLDRRRCRPPNINQTAARLRRLFLSP